MKQKTRFKNFGNIGIGLKKNISVDLYCSLPSQQKLLLIGLTQTSQQQKATANIK